MNVNEKAVSAAKNEDEFENFLKEYRPFIASCACKTAGRYVDEHDDEMSVAIVAFHEAVQRYRSGDGAFIPYAGRLIRCRLIDLQRQNGRTASTLSLDTDKSIGAGATFTPVYQSIRESRLEDPVALEVEALSDVLKAYGFCFMDIVKCSPKSKKTKKACAAAALCLLNNIDLLISMKQSKQLPVQKIEKKTRISQKLIGRHRNYIVCLAEILTGDYWYLSEYVKFVYGGETK